MTDDYPVITSMSPRQQEQWDKMERAAIKRGLRLKRVADNTDWSKQPFIGDITLRRMSDDKLAQFENPEMWVEDMCACGLRNITHCDNREWYMEHLMGQLARGEVDHDHVRKAIRMLPLPTQAKGTDNES